VRPRTLLLVAVVALLGVAAAVSPGLAGASVVKLEVNQNCVDPEWPCWTTELSALKPQPALTVKIAAGDEIMFTDNEPSSKTPAAVVWTSTPPSSCTGVPTSAMINWTGKCTFATSGTYKFESATLFDNENTLYGKANYRKYEIVVAGAPTDATTKASGETQTETMLNGSINPEGNTIVAYHFEYGSGSVTEHTTSPSTLSAADFTNDLVSAQVTGLLPGTTYQFRLVATYGAGNPVTGATTLTFKTNTVAVPTATTLAAEVSKETEATLKGTVNLGGEATEYFFEYGTDTNYGQKTAKATLQTSAGGNQGVSATLTGLAPGTEYHFRLVAENKHGPGEGVDLSFKTMSPASKEPTKEHPAKEPSPTPPPTGGNPTATTSSSPSSGQPGAGPASGELFGSVKLASTQHFSSVRGTIDISQAGVGGQLEVALLTTTASLAKAKHSSKVRVGRLLRSSLKAGVVSFTVPLTAKGKSALRRHKRLALTVQIVITPVHGAKVTMTKSVVLRA
jgi:hypothetical protein